MSVLVKITDSADFKNETTASRDSSQGLGLPNFFGLETAIPHMMAGATAANLLSGKGGTQKLEVDRVISAVGVVGNVEGVDASGHWGPLKFRLDKADPILGSRLTIDAPQRNAQLMDALGIFAPRDGVRATIDVP